MRPPEIGNSTEEHETDTNMRYMQHMKLLEIKNFIRCIDN